jgi:hypothetical protein
VVLRASGWVVLRGRYWRQLGLPTEELLLSELNDFGLLESANVNLFTGDDLRCVGVYIVRVSGKEAGRARVGREVRVSDLTRGHSTR